MASISIKGVLIGAAVDLGLSVLVGLAVVAALVAPLGIDGLDKLDDVAGSDAFTAAGYVTAALISAVAGYVAARIARKGELLNGALSSFLSVALALVSLVVNWLEGCEAGGIFDLVSAPMFGLIGGFLRARQVGDRG